MRFSGYRVIVTGGSSGIGRTAVEVFAQGGADVAVLDRSEPVGLPARATHWNADLASTTAVETACGGALEQLGGLDVLVNCAGIGAVGDVEEGELDVWTTVLDVNLLGVVRVVRACLPALRRCAPSSIVNVSSVVAEVGLPRRAAYSASKGAVSALTRAMAVDLAAAGVRVNSVCPGTVDTPWVRRLLDASDDPVRERRSLEARQPHGRLVDPAEVVQAIALLASRESGSLTGTSITIDGGLTTLRPPATNLAAR